MKLQEKTVNSSGEIGLKGKLGRYSKLTRKKKIIIGIVILLVVLLFGSRIIGGFTKDKAPVFEQTYIPVNAQTVSSGSVSTNITLSGKLIGDKEAPIMPKTPGRVQSLAVKVGDEVKKDQVLFSLDKADLQASYDQAAASYQLAQAGYARNLDAYNSAKANFERLKQLYEIGAVSKVELEAAEMQASDAVLKTAEAQLAQAKAGYDTMAKNYNDMDVKSPIDGIVTALNVKVGDMATSAAAAAAVVDLSMVHVEVGVSEKIINHIKGGQEVFVEIASAAKTVKGTIDSLSLAADARTGKYALKINIDNADGTIKPGMFAKVTVDTATKKDVLVIPSEAVVFRAGRNVVYIVNANKVLEKEVSIGLDNGKQAEVVSGLAAGDVIVIKGMNFVKDDSEIKVIELDGEPYKPAAPAQAGTQPEGGAKQ